MRPSRNGAAARPDPTGRPPLRRVGALVRAVVLRSVVFAVAWWALSEGDASTIRYGIPAAAVALGVSLVLSPPRARRREDAADGGAAGGSRAKGGTAFGPLRRGWALIVLICWFARQAVVGGADVAVRALRRPVAIDPVVVRAPIALPAGAARQVALVMLNLMPGTLVQAHEGDEARIHALSPELPVLEQWTQLQIKVGAAAGVGVSPHPPLKGSPSR